MADNAAPISVPGSIRPVISMVTWAWMGTSLPPPRMARRDPAIAGLDAEQIELGLDQQQIDPAVDQSACLLLVGVAEFRVGDLAERCELGAWSHGAGHGSRAARIQCSELIGDDPCQLSGVRVQLIATVGNVVFTQWNGESSECVRFGHVCAGCEVLPVHVADQLGSGVDQQLVASLEGCAAEIVGTEVERLDVRPRCPVEDDDAASKDRKSTIPSGYPTMVDDPVGQRAPPVTVPR